ncbi:uncharacterized protein METZ01_LOCUS411638, partial [marine metagenome]
VAKCVTQTSRHWLIPTNMLNKSN